MITVIRKIKSFITDFVPPKSMLAKIKRNSPELKAISVLTS